MSRRTRDARALAALFSAVVAATVTLWLSCASMVPDEYHLEVGRGTSEFDRPVNDFDTTALTIGATWGFGDRRRHREQMHAWRRLETTAATGELQPMEEESEGQSAAEAVATLPETREDAVIFVYWAVGIAVLATAAVVLHKAGLQLPFFRSKPKEEAA